MKENKKAFELHKKSQKIKSVSPEKNDPTKEEDDNDTTRPKPGITDPKRIDPTRKDDPVRTDPTRIEPEKTPGKNPPLNFVD